MSVIRQVRTTAAAGPVRNTALTAVGASRCVAVDRRRRLDDSIPLPSTRREASDLGTN